MLSREVRGGRGAGGSAGGAVGGSDGGEERRAGSGPWQRAPGGPGALVRTEPLETSVNQSCSILAALEDKLFERLTCDPEPQNQSFSIF